MKRGAKKTPAGKTARKRTPARKGEAELSFEQALERLEDIVHRLEEGEIPLEESIQAYAEGTRLVRQCMEKLEAADSMIKELTEGTEGFRLEPSGLNDDGDEKELENEDDDEEEDDEGGSGELPF